MELKKFFKKSRKFYLLALLLLIFTVPVALSGCGGGGGGSSSGGGSSASTITGSVIDGPVSGATITLFQVSGGTPTLVNLTAKITTQSNGAFSIPITDIPGYSTSNQYLVISSGGTDSSGTPNDMIGLLLPGISTSVNVTRGSTSEILSGNTSNTSLESIASNTNAPTSISESVNITTNIQNTIESYNNIPAVYEDLSGVYSGSIASSASSCSASYTMTVNPNGTFQYYDSWGDNINGTYSVSNFVSGVSAQVNILSGTAYFYYLNNPSTSCVGTPTSFSIPIPGTSAVPSGTFTYPNYWTVTLNSNNTPESMAANFSETVNGTSYNWTDTMTYESIPSTYSVQSLLANTSYENDFTSGLTTTTTGYVELTNVDGANTLYVPYMTSPTVSLSFDSTGTNFTGSINGVGSIAQGVFTPSSLGEQYPGNLTFNLTLSASVASGCSTGTVVGFSGTALIFDYSSTQYIYYNVQPDTTSNTSCPITDVGPLDGLLQLQ